MIHHQAYLYFVTTGKNPEIFKGHPKFSARGITPKIVVPTDKKGKGILPTELPNYRQGQLGREVKTDTLHPAYLKGVQEDTVQKAASTKKAPLKEERPNLQKTKSNADSISPAKPSRPDNSQDSAVQNESELRFGKTIEKESPPKQ